MPAHPDSSYADSHAYIPADAQRAMDQHMALLPASYHSYIDPAKPGGFVPPSVERTIKQHMDTMPAHLKQYSGAYMQQRVIQPGMTRPTAMPQGPRVAGVPPPPIPDPRRLSHNLPVSEQPTAQTNPVASGFVTPPTGSPAAVSSPPPAGPPAQPGQPFDFIMNPPQPPAHNVLSELSGGGLAKRIAIAAGGLLVLLIIFIVVKNLVAGGTDFTPFLAVAQDQQEIVHLSGEAAQQQSLSTTSQNLAATAQLSVGSSQTSLVKYLTDNHYKIGAKQLSLRISSATDSQLTTAVAAGDYDQTFRQIMQSQLTTYSNDLSKAYNGAGPKGRTLLKSDYAQAQLLLKQAGAGTNSSD